LYFLKPLAIIRANQGICILLIGKRLLYSGPVFRYTTLNFMEIISNPFFEFAAILIISALVALVALVGRFLRQPLIVAFIGVGIVVGPWGLGLLESIDKVHLLADMILFPFVDAVENITEKLNC